MGDIDVSHGPWCNTRTFPMRCKYCGKQVYYFTCDHGSKVFFDSPLGPPWPLHRCIGFLEAVYGREVIERGMAAMMMTPGIDPGYAERIQRAARAAPRPQPPQIVRQDPYEGAVTDEMGLLREIIRDIDIYKRFSMLQTTVGAALLGELGNGKWVQVTIHTAPLAGEDNSSFTCFINRKLFDRIGPITGDFISCRLRGVNIAGREPAWVCDEVSGAMG